jgi:hypothetical protein
MASQTRQFKVFVHFQSKHSNVRYSKQYHIAAKNSKQALLRARSWIGIGNIIGAQLGAN